MENNKKPGKRRRRNISHRSPRDRLLFPAGSRGRSEELDFFVNTQGLSALHMACLYGQLGPLQVLVKATLDELDSSDPQGRRPIHMVMSSQSWPKSADCLRFLLENGADISVTTDSGQTPLHHAAAAGFLDCVEILVQAGADVMAKDNMGHTPLDLARVWSHKDVGRYLRGCMWLAEKEREMEERKQVRVLYRELVAEAKLYELNKRIFIERKTSEWAAKKGLPNIKAFSPRVMVSQYHTKCLSSDQDTSNVGHRKHKPRPRESRLDLHDCVMVWTDSSGRPQYITKWESLSRYAPDVPLDILKRGLFPMASRIKSPQDFKAQVIKEVTHRRHPQGSSRSPWTEVAEHLVEDHMYHTEFSQNQARRRRQEQKRPHKTSGHLITSALSDKPEKARLSRKQG